MDMNSRELVDLDALAGIGADLRADLDDDLHIQAVVAAERDQDLDSPSSLKRAGSDFPADNDQSTAKKRRKQSKPVRINAPESSAPLTSDTVGKNVGETSIDQEEPGPEPETETEGEARLSPNLDLEVQVHCQTGIESDRVCRPGQETPLNLCSLPKTEPCSPTGFEDFPILSGKAGSPVGLEASNDLSNIGTPSQPPHERQSSQQLLNNYWGMSSPFLYPMISAQDQQVTPHHQSRCSPDNRTGSCTIFNPDAYCELCNKEFCNKYFLKTHKANKHGIFTSSPGQPTSQTPVSDISFDSNFPNKSSASYPCGLLPPRTLSPSSENGLKLNSSIKLQKEVFNPKANNKLFVRKIKVKLFSTNGEDLAAPATERVKMEEDFYEADVERMLSGMSPQVSQREVIPPSDSAPNFKSKERDREDAPVQITRAVAPVGSEREAGETAEGSAGDSNESTGILRKDAQDTPDKPVFTPERMRRLGVINPEAFCEICCKEYCNKYFLRTHKWKRHGIAPPEGEDKDMQRPTPSWLQQVQAAPLNLIMDDSPVPTPGAGWDAQRLPNNTMDPMNVSCKYCGQWFPSEQVLQVHVAFVHLCKKEKDTEFVVDPFTRKTEPVEGEKNPNTCDRAPKSNGDRKSEQIESIIDDVKKVQSMLFQLNSLNASSMPGVRSDETTSPTSASNTDPTQVNQAAETPSQTIPALPCTVCKKSFPDKTSLQQHMQDLHWNGPPPPLPAVKVERERECEPGTSQTPSKVTPQQGDPAGSQEPSETKPVTSTPTSSYCEICNKELCNKYFMKTHMQRMHGIEIENGSQIGGVVCDICNKELCSKYFLRVHKQNTHGIVDESTGPPTQVRDNGTGTMFGITGGHFMDVNNQALKPTDLSEMSHRYFTHFNEVCNICNRRFRSVKWLKAHLINDHGRSEYEATAETNDRLPKMPPTPMQFNDLGAQLGLGPNGFNVPQSRDRNRPPDAKSRQRLSQEASQNSNKNGNHYLSNFMQVAGGTSKEYRCSYCPFSTPVLAFLYVHEKSHTGLTYLPNSEPKKEYPCPVCYKNFSKLEHFQRHLLSHQYSGLPGTMFGTLDPRNMPFPPPPPKEARRDRPHAAGDREDEPVTEAEDKTNNNALSLSDSPVQNQTEVSSSPFGRERATAATATSRCPKCTGEMLAASESTSEDQPHYDKRCTTCGYTSDTPTHAAAPRRERDLSSLESLLKETVTSDVKRRLEDVAKLNDIPASYAVPKPQDSDSDPFIMQPFIIEEPRGEEEDPGTPQSMDKKFVPSLVFLPVKERLSRPLTASFTLTPA